MDLGSASLKGMTSRPLVVGFNLTFNEVDWTLQSAASITAQVDHAIVVDNGSDGDIARQLAAACEKQDIEYLNTGANLGYAGGCNRAAQRALQLGADFILVMNNDAVLEEGAVRELVSALETNSRIAAAQPMVCEMERPEVVLHTTCSIDLRTGLSAWQDRGRNRGEVERSIRDTGYVSGECFLVRRQAVEDLGLFDERLGFYCEDSDWSLRALGAGWRLITVPTAVVRHVVGETMPSARGAYLRARNRSLLVRAHTGRGKLATLGVGARVVARQCLSFGRHGQWGVIWPTVAGWFAGATKTP